MPAGHDRAAVAEELDKVVVDAPGCGQVGPAPGGAQNAGPVPAAGALPVPSAAVAAASTAASAGTTPYTVQQHFAALDVAKFTWPKRLHAEITEKVMAELGGVATAGGTP